MDRRMSKEEKEWMAEDDARTLMRAEEIKGDSSRKSAAIKKVNDIISQAEKTVKTAKNVKGGNKKKTTKKTSRKNNRRKK